MIRFSVQMASATESLAMAIIVGDETDNTLVGTSDADQISGLGGNDSLSGDAGDDLLEGGDGADSLGGGSGTDTASYAGSSAGVTVNLATGTSTRSEEHTSELQSLMRISYAVFCLKKKNTKKNNT